ncbi:MAG: hypothetical protein MHPSP_002424 [Paramarteilia canceri]
MFSGSSSGLFSSLKKNDESQDHKPVSFNLSNEPQNSVSSINLFQGLKNNSNNNSTKSLFSSINTPASMPGQGNTQPNLFSTSNQGSIFGNQKENSISLFSNQNQNAMSIFSNPTQDNANNTVNQFSTSNQSPATSLFQTQNQTNNTLFSSQNTSNNASLFSSQNIGQSTENKNQENFSLFSSQKDNSKDLGSSQNSQGMFASTSQQNRASSLFTSQNSSNNAANNPFSIIKENQLDTKQVNNLTKTNNLSVPIQTSLIGQSSSNQKQLLQNEQTNSGGNALSTSSLFGKCNITKYL